MTWLLFHRCGWREEEDGHRKPKVGLGVKGVEWIDQQNQLNEVSLVVGYARWEDLSSSSRAETNSSKSIHVLSNR